MALEELSGLKVPALIMSPRDVARLRREIDALSSYLKQVELRASGPAEVKLPKTSRLLDELAVTNKLDLLNADTRSNLADFLTDVAEHSPVVNISFATDPSSAFLQKLVLWLRQNIHASILVRVGLQPTIAAGCVVRTTNRYFDMSLRNRLYSHRQELLRALEAAS